MADESQTTGLWISPDHQEAERIVAQALELVCNDGNSDAQRAAHDVISALNEAGFIVFRGHPS